MDEKHRTEMEHSRGNLEEKAQEVVNTKAELNALQNQIQSNEKLVYTQNLLKQ